jgi:tetratricopeptide (TPR) repeat protein
VTQLQRRIAAAIFILSASLSLWHFISAGQSPFFDSPAIDEAFHHQWATAWSQGEAGPQLPFFRAPLYPAFLTFVYSLFNGSIFAGRLAGLLLGILNLFLVGLLLQRNVKHPSWLVVFGLYAFNGTVIYFQPELLIVTFFISLLLGGFLLLQQSQESSSVISAGGAGLLFGLATIARPSLLIFLPLLFIWLWRYRKSWPQTSSLILLLLLPILTVTAVNRFAGGETVLVATQGGVNFYIGNHAEADGWSSSLPPAGVNWTMTDARLQALRDTGKQLTDAQLSDYFYRESWQEITAAPKRWLKLMLYKTALLCSRTEIGNNRDIQFSMRQRPPLAWLHNWTLIPLLILGLLGMVRLLRSRDPRHRLWLGFILSYGFGIVLFFVNARFRLPLLPFLTIFAGLELAVNFEHKHHRQRVSHLEMLALLGISLLVIYPHRATQQDNNAQSHLSLGNAWLRQGRLMKAETQYRIGLQEDSLRANLHLNLGVIAWQRDDHNTAQQEYELELKYHPTSLQTLANLGALYHMEGDYRAAEQVLGKALRLNPLHTDAAYNYRLTCERLAAGFELREMADSAAFYRERFRKAVTP